MATCDAAERGCAAPAGYRTSNGIALAPPAGRLPLCYRCGRNVCRACGRMTRTKVARRDGGVAVRRVLMCPDCRREEERAS